MKILNVEKSFKITCKKIKSLVNLLDFIANVAYSKEL